MRRKTLAVAVSLTVSIIFLYLAFRRIDFSELGDRIRQVDLAILSLALFSKLGWFTLASLRTRVLVSPVRSVPIPRLFKSLLLAFAANNIFFFRLGELARIDYLARHEGAPRTTFLAVAATERLLDAIVLLSMFLVTLPFVMGSFTSSTSLAAIVGVVSVITVVILLTGKYPDLFIRAVTTIAALGGSRVRSFADAKSRSFAEGLAALASVKKVLLVVLLTIGMWSCGVLTIEIWLSAFGVDLPWYGPMYILGFGAFGAALPASPANIGTYHYFTILALTQLGIPLDLAGSLAITGHAMSYIPYTLIGLPLALSYFSLLTQSIATGGGEERA